jgi:hypothetical protein
VKWGFTLIPSATTSRSAANRQAVGRTVDDHLGRRQWQVQVEVHRHQGGPVWGSYSWGWLAEEG